MYTLTETIAAISTAPQLAAIAVIRISGDKAFDVLEKIFQPHGKKDFPYRYAASGIIKDGNKIIDEVLAIKFKGPHSYTGEDLVEFHCHGGPFVAQKILSLILSCDGVRIAERGEFTYRAFINGKMDLTQAEAVLQIIEAKSDLSLQISIGQLKGKLSNIVKSWKTQLVDILSIIEVQIDHTEDEVEPIPRTEVLEKLQKLLNDMEKIIRKTGEFLNIDIPVTIVGKPNVGKSSLFNALAEEERVIVTPIAGTTTDIVSEVLHWGGMSWKIHDTAGIGSEPADIIEKIGQQKAHQKLQETQMILLVLDVSEPLDERDFEVADKIAKLEENKVVVVVLNKSDKKSLINHESLESLLAKFKVRPLVVSVSSKTLQGVDELKNTLSKIFAPQDASEIVVASIRQKNAISNTIKFLKNAVNEINATEEVLAHHIKMAVEQLKELLGEITTEDILEEIFSKFCIGK